jgi:hypothetical protein
MSETLEPMATEVDQKQLAEQLLAQAKEQGVELVGPNGLCRNGARIPTPRPNLSAVRHRSRVLASTPSRGFYGSVAISRSSSSSSRWSSMSASPGTARRQPVSPKEISRSVLVQVMLRACPSTGNDSG